MTREQRIDNRVRARASERQGALKDWSDAREAAKMTLDAHIANPESVPWSQVLHTMKLRDEAAAYWGMMWRSDLQKEQLCR